jgi:DNA-binding MarR family transcriptional regulator
MRILGMQLLKELHSIGLELALEHVAMLHFINMNQEIIQQDLAVFLHRDKAAIMRNIDELEEKRLVVRRADPDDRRKNILSLTKQGQSALQQVIECEAKIFEVLTQGIPAANVEIMKQTIFAMQMNGAKMMEA